MARIPNLFLFTLLALTLAACKDNTPAVVEQETNVCESDSMEEYAVDLDKILDTLDKEFMELATEFPESTDFDRIDDLVAFFHSVEDVHNMPFRYDLEENRKEVYSSIQQIEKYRHGETTYYPEEDLNSLLETMAYDITNLENHGVSDFCRGFFYYYLQLAAYYCPDISYLVDMRTEDYKAGIKYYRYYSTAALFESFLLTERANKKGFNVHHIGDAVQIESIYKLHDDQSNTYYLCSNHNPFLVYFAQYLYLYRSPDDIPCVAEITSIDVPDYPELYFNKEQKAWYACRRDAKTDKLIPIYEAPVLTLHLDGEHSKFIPNTDIVR